MKNQGLSWWLSFLCFAAIGFLQAQGPDSLRFQRSIQAVATFATNDNFSNTYLISPENALEKYDSLGRKVATFSNKRLGQAAFVDASNPLKILVWYPDFQTVLLLDRTLTEMGRLVFSNLGLYSVRCVSMSFDGNIWVFDDAISKAIKLSLDGSMLLESPPLNVYFPQRFSATRMRDSGQFVCLNDPASGMCTLDQYANIQNVYNTLRIADFETEGAWMYYRDKDKLCLQNLGHLLQLFLNLPAGVGKSDSWLGKQCFYWQHGDRLELYSW